MASASQDAASVVRSLINEEMPELAQGKGPQKLCPGCEKFVPEDTQICIGCGFDFRAGKQRVSKTDKYREQLAANRQVDIDSLFAQGESFSRPAGSDSLVQQLTMAPLNIEAVVLPSLLYGLMVAAVPFVMVVGVVLVAIAVIAAFAAGILSLTMVNPIGYALQGIYIIVWILVAAVIVRLYLDSCRSAAGARGPAVVADKWINLIVYAAIVAVLAYGPLHLCYELRGDPDFGEFGWWWLAEFASSFYFLTTLAMAALHQQYVILPIKFFQWLWEHRGLHMLVATAVFLLMQMISTLLLVIALQHIFAKYVKSMGPAVWQQIAAGNTAVQPAFSWWMIIDVYLLLAGVFALMIYWDLTFFRMVGLITRYGKYRSS